MKGLAATNYKFPKQTSFYKGKVRDVYSIDNKWLVMVVTDRVSAFDVVLPRAIPYKGAVLNQIAAHFMNATSTIVPNWIVDVPDEQVSIGIPCQPLKVEMVIRGYLSGHAWREYNLGKRMLCGVNLPEGLRESDLLPQPIITPTTKAAHGHDQDISRAEIISNGIVEEAIYEQVEKYTHQLYQKGVAMAKERGLILVDTKYEFGINNGKVFLIDEIHTPDSSRYFYADGYEERQKLGQPQKQLSKEFLRQWLIENNFQGLAGQTVPEMSDEIVQMVSERYVELYENITGKAFVKPASENIEERIFNNISNALQKLR
ncbi:MAG TPA: phosphoribosylaminoimidazolesuccinocarboxamide synthase [Bacteroidia bacterium]|jgi:phosphoribosylaminoimidazole-succinocarboxamide synthase|nr:phosphoribosylaminoimidazolesuccinocarboxamide synthase [Bacteroidia bacterium]HMU18219.1 phosphoribosylaminoimidazolesuccinocarboxamide synthase [Bacteroidia bacterium]